MHRVDQRVLTHRQRVIHRPNPRDEEGRDGVQARTTGHRFGVDDWPSK